jgi:glucose/arabinose dehydrogenase
VNPILVRPEAWSGATFVRGDRYPGLHGWLVVASLSAERLLGVSFRADGSVAATVVLADKQWGRLRDVIEGPDGCLYVATSNRDGRGTPRSRDDQILRLREVRH